MAFYTVDKRTMLLVYDFTAQDVRKDLRGTANWRVFWHNFPFTGRMTTYNCIQRGKLARTVGSHAKAQRGLCPHQVRLTIPVNKCQATENDFKFDVVELKACVCAECLFSF